MIKNHSCSSAPATVPIKNIHSWSCSGSSWKTLTSAGMTSVLRLLHT